MFVFIYKVLGALTRYRKVSYIINEHEEKDIHLASDALLSYYKEKGFNVKVFYISPYSLINDKNLLRSFNENEIKKYFTDKILTKFKDPEYFDIIIVNSMGKYKIADEEYEFESTPNNIQLQLFFEMLKHEKDIEEEIVLIADISTGLNLYVSTLFEALRAIIVKRKLQNRGIKAYYAISEPIIGEVIKDKYRIYLCEYDVKAFFESPIRSRRIDEISKLSYYIEDSGELKRNIDEKSEYLREKMKNFLKIFTLAFNSIKFNTPLAFYTYKNQEQKLIDLNFDIESLENNLIEFFVDKYEGIIKPKINGNKIFTYKVKDKELFNIFYSMAMYRFMKNKLKDAVKESEPNIEDIFSLFDPIYKDLNLELNRRFLAREIDEIKENKDRIPNYWIGYNEIIKRGIERRIEEDTTYKKSSDIVRNFFAHSGFESTVIEVKRDGEKIRVRYKKDRINEVEKWIKEAPG